MPKQTSDLLGDSLFQVNFVLWLMQPPNRSGVRPLFAEAGYKLHAIEQPLSLGVELVQKLQAAGIVVRRAPQADVLLVTDDSSFLLIECKSKMFSTVTTGDDGHLRQARAYLLQTKHELSSALGGMTVGSSHLGYFTRHDCSHNQAAALETLTDDLRAAGCQVIDYCIFRMSDTGGGIALLAPKKNERWPDPLRKLLGKSKAKVVVLPRDKSGNDPRPLYAIPWMPDAECNPTDDYNRRVFGNRILAAATTRVGRAPVGEHLAVLVDDLLSDVTLGMYGRWKNRDAKSALRASARRLISKHLKDADAQFSDPSNRGDEIRILLPDEKAKNAIVRAFRDEIDKNWKPDERTLFDKPDDYWDSEPAS